MSTHTDPRSLTRELEDRAELPDVPDRERLRGYAVTGLPFRSGHILAMRRFPATSVGPGYTSVWHRDPSGHLAIYQDQEPRFSCPRVFGPEVDEAPVVPIRLDWPGPRELHLDINTEEVRLHWEMRLSSTLATRAVNAAAGVVPRSLRRSAAFLAAAGRGAGPLLRAGRVRLTGTVPSGQEFKADLRRIWTIEDSVATVNGADLGLLGPTPSQEHLGDFWLPQRGIFAIADAFFEPYDPARHDQVATRGELQAASA